MILNANEAKEIITRLWKLANTPPSATAGKTHSQKRALRVLLETGGGVEFLVTRPQEELKELEKRGIWAGPAILQELAGLELQRRRAMVALADIGFRTRQIFQDLGLGKGSVPKTLRNRRAQVIQL